MQQVGRHSFKIEDDTAFIKYIGAVTLDNLKSIAELTPASFRAQPVVYLVYDVSEAGLMTPEARRYLAERSKTITCAALVIHGTTLLTRAAIALVLAAVRLIGTQMPHTVYVDSEKAARDWIGAHRRSQQ